MLRALSIGKKYFSTWEISSPCVSKHSSSLCAHHTAAHTAGSACVSLRTVITLRQSRRVNTSYHRCWKSWKCCSHWNIQPSTMEIIGLLAVALEKGCFLGLFFPPKKIVWEESIAINTFTIKNYYIRIKLILKRRFHKWYQFVKSSMSDVIPTCHLTQARDPWITVAEYLLCVEECVCFNILWAPTKTLTR